MAKKEEEKEGGTAPRGDEAEVAPRGDEAEETPRGVLFSLRGLLPRGLPFRSDSLMGADLGLATTILKGGTV